MAIKRTLVVSAIALGACTARPLQLDAPFDLSSSPRPDMTAPVDLSGMKCPGDEALQRISLSLAAFAATESTTTATLENGELVIRSSVTGSLGANGTIGVQDTGTVVMPTLVARGVRVCYSLDNVRTQLRQIRLAQETGPGPIAQVAEDDTANLDHLGPYCTDPLYFHEVENRSCLAVDPSNGAFQVFLGLTIGDVADAIHVQSVDLVVSPPT